MIEFKNALKQRLLALVKDATDINSGLSPYVKTYDDHLYDVPLTDFPFVVCTVRNDELEDVETAQFGTHVWSCILYYLDTTQENESWDDGESRRDTILGALHKALEKNKFLADNTGPLQTVDPDGAREYVWQSEITNVTFDGSGHEGYYTFVSEMYLSVHTAKS